MAGNVHGSREKWLALRRRPDLRHGDAGDTFHKYTATLEAAPAPEREAAPPPPPAPLVKENGSTPRGAPKPVAALTLDLPPPPDFSSWSVDAVPSLTDASSAGPAIAEQAAAPSDSPEPGSVSGALQQWLAAIVSDRSIQR